MVTTVRGVRVDEVPVTGERVRLLLQLLSLGHDPGVGEDEPLYQTTDEPVCEGTRGANDRSE